MINTYTTFRLVLLSFTIYGFLQLVANVLRFKPYYEKIPPVMKRYFFRKGGDILGKKFVEHRHDFAINGLLLVVLVLLNVIAFMY